MKYRAFCGLLIASMLFLGGCGSKVVDAGYGADFSGMLIRHNLDGAYSILEDRNSGVCYLEYCIGYHYGITVMLNPDGTPKLWSDMKN